VSEEEGSAEVPFPPTGSIPVYRPEPTAPTPAPAAHPPGIRGRMWLVVVIAGGVLSALTAPGQTAGLSPFTDRFINELDISRTLISSSYLLATLAGAIAMPLVGRLLDRYGGRLAGTWIVVVLSLVLVGASFVTEIIGLTASYVGLRMAGQGALTLAATTLVAQLVTHRSGLALGIAGAMGAGGVSLAPVFIEQLISATDFRTAFLVEAAIVAVVGLIMVAIVPSDRQKTHTDTGTIIIRQTGPGVTLREARRSSMFWVFTLTGFTVGMMSTGLAFHLISILGEQGLTSIEAASNFIPQTIAALLTTLALGAVVDRVDPRWGVVVSMVALIGAMVMLPVVEPGGLSIVFGLLLGASQGAHRGVEAAAFLRYFGPAHIGAIRGFTTAILVASTALGPLYFAIGLDIFGSYGPVSVYGALLPVAIIIFALFAKNPPAFEGATSGRH
jgi:MFS family permease